MRDGGGADEPPGLLLRDFKPRSMLKVPAHEVERAAFPAVDVHNHVNDARGADRPSPSPSCWPGWTAST